MFLKVSPALLQTNPRETGSIPTLTVAAIELADMAQKFVRAETYARVKGRPAKRHSIAVVIGMDGRPAPHFGEFDIADSGPCRRIRLDQSRLSCPRRIGYQPPQHHSGRPSGAQQAPHGQARTKNEERERKSRVLKLEPVKHVLGLSGGRDSAALAVYMRQHYPDLAIEYFFTDTGKELPEVYEYLGRLEGFLGQPIKRLNPDRNFRLLAQAVQRLSAVRRKRAGVRASSSYVRSSAGCDRCWYVAHHHLQLCRDPERRGIPSGLFLEA